MHKTKQGLNGLRDLIGCHGFGCTLSAAPIACLKSEECSYLFLFYFILFWFGHCGFFFFFFFLMGAIELFGEKNRNLEFTSQQKNKFSIFFFFFLLSTSTMLTSKNIFIIYNFIA